jgi:hypothetical protein
MGVTMLSGGDGTHREPPARAPRCRPVRRRHRPASPALAVEAGDLASQAARHEQRVLVELDVERLGAHRQRPAPWQQRAGIEGQEMVASGLHGLGVVRVIQSVSPSTAAPWIT